MRDAPHGCHADLVLMGIPTRFEADRPELLDAALAACAAWPRPDGAGSDAGIRIALRSGSGEGAGGAPTVRVAGGRLVLEGPGVRGEADAARREAVCTVPPELAGNPGRLAAEVVDTLALFLLTRAGRVPLHAAGVMLGDTAVVLAGRSGTGKSTLALAALRAGLRVLSDDAVYVQLEPRLRVWGFPRPIHLLPDAEADPGGVLRLRGGRWKVAVPPGEWAGEPVAERAVLCLLERGRAVALEPMGPDAAVEEVTASLEPGFDHFRGEVPAVARALAAGGAWRLTLSPDPAEAVAALRGVVGEG
jgi:hypothetical protein